MRRVCNWSMVRCGSGLKWWGVFHVVRLDKRCVGSAAHDQHDGGGGVCRSESVVAV